MAYTKEMKGFSIVHLYMRSITRHWEEMCAELVKYDVISFTETWLSPIVIDRLISLDGYTMIRQDRNILMQNG